MGGAEGAAAPPGASQVDPSYGSSGSWLARGTVPPIASASYPSHGATAGAAGAAGSGGAEADKGGAQLEGAPAEFEPLGKNKGGAIPKFFGPMRLYASSFSSKTISDKTLAMEEAVDELAEAATSLQIAADGTIKDTGLFSFLGGKKTMDEGSRSKLAQDAYKKGVLAFNKYIEIGNDGLGISFAPMDTID